MHENFVPRRKKIVEHAGKNKVGQQLKLLADFLSLYSDRDQLMPTLIKVDQLSTEFTVKWWIVVRENHSALWFSKIRDVHSHWKPYTCVEENAKVSASENLPSEN